MKKLLLVLFCALFGFSCAGGGILLAQDLPSMVENDGEGISASLNDEIEAQASGYWSSYYAGSFADGSGTSSDPYLIETAAQLARVAYLSNSSSDYSSYRTDYFELIADIDLSDHYWVPIGRNYSFNGHFNGNYHTISGMTCYVSSSSSSYYTNVADASNGLCAGLFGTLGGSAYVANFALNDVVITTGTSSLNSATFKIGAVAAAVLGTSSSSNVTIFQVNVFGSITDSFSGGGNEERIGGIVGYARNVAIAYCQSYVTISTSSSRGSNSSDSWAWCVGGIVGALEYSGTYVYSCAFLGYINSYLVAGGGIAGVVNDQAKIRCCYAVRGQYSTSSASNYFYLGTRDCGGIVGSLHSNASIVSCWASVDPRHRGSYEYFEGGLAGSISGGGNIYCSMWNSYFITSSYASADSGTRYGITSYSSSNSSYFRRSSSFTTYMRSDSYGENWMSSAWTITSSSSSYGHLNYGFPHVTYTRVQNNVSVNDNVCNINWEFSSSTTLSYGCVDTSFSSATSNSSLYYTVLGAKFYLDIDANGYIATVFDYLGQEVYDPTTNISSATLSLTTSGLYSSHSYGTHVQHSYNIYCRPFDSGYWDANYDENLGGSGTASDPWQISTAEQLAFLSYASNSSIFYETFNDDYYILTNDIDLSGKIWIPIGLKHSFTGDFDGDGYVINGVTCTMFSNDDEKYSLDARSSSYFGMGLFGSLNGANIHHFVLSNVAIYSENVYYDIPAQSSNVYMGGVAAYATGASSTSPATISQVGVWGKINDGFYGFPSNRYVGGIVGYIGSYVNVSESFNSATLSCGSYRSMSGYDHPDISDGTSSSYGYVGGIAGYNNGASVATTISDCYNNGDLQNYGGYTGGLFGRVYTRLNVYRCYNSGDISSSNYLGGLFGYVYTSSSYVLTVYNCFNDGATNRSSTNIGAFAGYTSGSYSTYYYCAYNSNDESTKNGGGTTPTYSSNYSYTSSSSSRPDTGKTYSVFTGGSQDWDIDYAGKLVIATQASTWIHPYYRYLTTAGIGTTVGYRYLNNSFPILQWTLRTRSVSSDFSSAGSTTIALVAGAGTTSGTTGTGASNSRLAVLGQPIKLTATELTPYSNFEGFSENETSDDFIGTSSSFTTYVKGGVSKYVGVFSTSSTKTVYYRVVVVNSDGTLSYPTSTSQVAAISYTRYTSGDPWDTSRATGSSYNSSRGYYLYRPVTWTYTLNNLAYKFVGWRLGASSTFSTTSTSLESSSSSWSYTPLDLQTMYVWAVFEPNDATAYFSGSWVSIDGGSSYEENNSRSMNTSRVRFVQPNYSSINDLSLVDIRSYDRGLPIEINYTNNTQFLLDLDIDDRYQFEGWYYSSSQVTTSNINSATLLTNSQTYTSTGVPPLDGKYFFAKFVRKTPTITFSIRISQDGQTFTTTVPSSGLGVNVSYYNSANIYQTSVVSTNTSLITQTGTTITFNNSGTGYNFVGFSTSTTPPSSSTLTNTLTCPTGNTTYYLYFMKNSGNRLKYDSTDQYWYFEDGKYPQSYVGDSLNSTLTNSASSTGSSITYFNGTSNVSIPIYSYNGTEYARLQASRTMTIQTSVGSVDFTSGHYYFFKVESIRWRVSEYGVSSTDYPEGWDKYGSYNTNFMVVSDRVLMASAVTNQTVSEGWAFTSSELFSNVSISNTHSASAYADPEYDTSRSVTYYRYGNAGQQDKVTTVSRTENGLRVASVDEIEESFEDNRAYASDMVCFLLGIGRDEYANYWTRTLGTNLGNGKIITSAGMDTSSWLDNMFGVRFAMTMGEGSRI